MSKTLVMGRTCFVAGSLALVFAASSACSKKEAEADGSAAGEVTTKTEAATTEQVEKKAADPEPAAEAPSEGADACAELAQKICGGNDCEKAEKWLNDKVGRGPNEEALTDDQKAAGCKAVLDSEASLEGYKKAFTEASK